MADKIEYEIVRGHRLTHAVARCDFEAGKLKRIKGQSFCNQVVRMRGPALFYKAPECKACQETLKKVKRRLGYRNVKRYVNTEARRKYRERVL